jgi:hypothetical protein
MEKKKVILTLCKSFPVTHSKAGEATDFEKKLKDKSKIIQSDTTQKMYGMDGIKILFLVKNIFQYVNGLADRIIRSKRK